MNIKTTFSDLPQKYDQRNLYNHIQIQNSFSQSAEQLASRDRRENSWSSSVVHVNCISIMINQDVNTSLPASNKTIWKHNSLVRSTHLNVMYRASIQRRLSDHLLCRMNQTHNKACANMYTTLTYAQFMLWHQYAKMTNLSIKSLKWLSQPLKQAR